MFKFCLPIHTQTSNFMKTSPVGAKLFNVERWTVNQSDRQTDRKQFCECTQK